MAVTLPSDLIADVMRNADPARLERARDRLVSMSGESSPAADFAQVLDGGASAVSFQTGGEPGPRTRVEAGVEHKPSTGPYVEFERMVLRNLLESLLPDASSGAFGGGPSAGVWRSLAADQLSSLYAGAGGIGIAESLDATGGQNQQTGMGQWPYFRSDGIKAFAG